MKQWFVLWITVVMTWTVQAAEPQITADLANRSAFLGDGVGLAIKVSYEAGWEIDAATLPDEMGKATVLSQAWTEPTNIEGSNLLMRELRARIAWYELGEHQLPTIEIKASGPDGEVTLETPAFDIEIINMLTEEDQEMAPAKGQVAMEEPMIWPWIVAGIALIGAIIAALIYFFIKRKEGSSDTPDVPAIPPYPEAMQALEQLTHGPMLKEGRFKEFHVALNSIIRRYYARVYQIHAEEWTSFEMEDWMMNHKGLPEGAIDLNSSFQSQCDMVKFAKHDPMDAENKQIVTWAYEIIELLKPVEEVDDVAVS